MYDWMASMEANLRRLLGGNTEISELIEDSLEQIEEINKFYEITTLERKRNILVRCSLKNSYLMEHDIEPLESILESSLSI